MKKLKIVIGVLSIMALMGSSVLAVSPDTINNGTTPFSNTTNEDPMPVTATTSQTDAYQAIVAWGDMAFDYSFGTWNPDNQTWNGEGWVVGGFNGTKDQVTVTNESSQPLKAAFAYAPDGSHGSNTTGTFTNVSGNLDGQKTGNMELVLCPEVGTAPPVATTYLNLQNRPDYVVPDASGETPSVEIGAITVSLTTEIPTATATAELAKVTNAVVTTLPTETANNKTDVEAAMLILANDAVGAGYIVTIAENPVSTYNDGTNAWTGRFIVSDGTTTATDATDRAITVVITP